MYKKEVSVLSAVLFLVILSCASLAFDTITFDSYELTSEIIIGYSFSNKEFVNSEESDIFMIKEQGGEGVTYYISSSFDNILNKGKEDVSDFLCDETNLEDYENKSLIYEKQGYCILTEEEIFKIYIYNVDAESGKVSVRWGKHISTIESEEIINEYNEQKSNNAQGEGKGGEGGGGAFGSVKDKVLDFFTPEETFEDETQEEENNDEGIVKKIIKKIKQIIVDNRATVIAIIVILVLYSVLAITLSEYRKRWKKKHKK